MADLTERLTYVLKGDAGSLRRELKLATSDTQKAGKSIGQSFGAINAASQEATDAIGSVAEAAKTTRESGNFLAGFASALDEAGTSFSEITAENVEFGKSMAEAQASGLSFTNGLGFINRALVSLQGPLIGAQGAIAGTAAASLDAEFGLGKFAGELENVEDVAVSVVDPLEELGSASEETSRTLSELGEDAGAGLDGVEANLEGVQEELEATEAAGDRLGQTFEDLRKTTGESGGPVDLKALEEGQAAVRKFGDEVQTQIGERSPGLFFRLGQTAGRVLLGLREKIRPFVSDLKAGLDGVEQEARETDGALTRIFGRIGTRFGEGIRFGSGKIGRIRRNASDITKVFLAIFGRAAKAIKSGAQKLFSAIPLPDLDLTARLRPNLQGLSETVPEIDEVVQKTDELSESLNQASEESDYLLTKIAALGIVVAAAATAMVAFGINSITSLDELADRIDIPIERFSVLRQGIQNLGARGGAIDEGLGNLSTALQDIDDDSTAAGAALKALGITATEPEKALLQLSEALRTTRESEERTRAVTALLGDTTRELVPILEEGSEAIQFATGRAGEFFGVGVTGEGAEQAERFTRNLKAIGSQFTALGDGIKLSATQAILPSLVDISDTVRTTSDQANIFQGIFEGFRRTFELTFGEGVTGEDPLGLGFARKNLEGAEENVKAIEERIRTIESGERIRFNVYGQDLLAANKRNLEEAKQFAIEAAKTVQKIAAEEAARVGEGVGGAAAVAPTAGAAPVAAGAPAALRDIELETDAQRQLRAEREKTQGTTIQGLQRELALLKAGTDEARARFELEEGRFATFDQATKDQIEALQTAIDLEKERTKQLEESEKAADALARSVESQLEGAERAIALGDKATQSARLRFELTRGRFQDLEGEKRLELEALVRKLEIVEIEKVRNTEQIKAKALLEGEVASLTQQIELAQARTEIERTRITLAGERFASLTDEQRLEIETLQVRLQSIQAEKTAREELSTFARTVIEEGLTLKERQIEAEARLNAAFHAGFLTQEQLQAAIERTAKKFQDLADKGDETHDRIAEFGKAAASELGKGFQDLLFDPSEEGFKAMGAKWAETLQKMAAEALAQNLFGSLFGGGGGKGGGGGLGGILAGLFADGGRIRGPGSSTSDSVPILASDGEFMQPARAVSHYGEDFMESVRRLQFPRVPSVPRLHVPERRRFATGGLVTVDADRGGNETAAPSNDLTVALLRSEDELEEFMSTAKGEKATIRLLERNRAQVRRILG